MEIDAPFAISERSVLSDRYIFAENGKKGNLFGELEWQLYLEYFNWLTAKFKANEI